MAHNKAMPRPSDDRLSWSLIERPFDLSIPPDRQRLSEKAPPTVLYLAYGSNMCYKTFQGMRHIRPLAALNVVVPDLIMAFDLPGIPYKEPCFANTRYRSAPAPSSPSPPSNLLWPKGMVGVVYEVTLADFAHILATEGGGASYQDELVTCHELLAGTSTVPADPQTPAFKAHTLYTPPGGNESGASHRPNPDYAQPSARYLSLLRSGAAEHGIPAEYRDYLDSLQPYTPTHFRQRVGGVLLLAVFAPIFLPVLGLSRLLADMSKSGKSPMVLRKVLSWAVKTVWRTYDVGFKPVFGDGERTQDRGEDDADRSGSGESEGLLAGVGEATGLGSVVAEGEEKAVVVVEEEVRRAQVV